MKNPKDKFLSLLGFFAALCFSPVFLYASPTIESMQERLEEEIAKLDSERDERIEALRQQYLTAVERQLEGNLPSDNREALQGERDRVRNEDELHPGSPSDHPALNRLHEALIEQIQIAEKPRLERLTTLIENLQNFSENQARTLRQQGQRDKAEEWENWGKALPARHLSGAAAAAGVSGVKTRFMSLLEAGDEPYLIIVGTSTSEHQGGAVNAPWRQCASGNRSNWPPVLASALSDIGPVRIGGRTCAGVSSKEFLNRGQLDWVVEQKPDAVLMEFAPGGDCVGRFNMTVADSRAIHEQMIEKLRAANPDMEIFLWTGLRSTNQGRRNYWDDRNGSGRAASNESQAEYAQMYVDLANDMPGVYAVDTYPIFQQLYEEDSGAYRTFLRDGNHTNRRAGEEIIIPTILEVMGKED
ncbi:MAG: SGNH/GDSL hydrolase family protein [Opitutales bacterium]|nr:SGNH/GDSL hydrolase family protein [Opitutales bacterium]MCH8540119.1 SGNH/GDSL hydrolase family protein [Opitutales bacterium]